MAAVADGKVNEPHERILTDPSLSEEEEASRARHSHAALTNVLSAGVGGDDGDYVRPVRLARHVHHSPSAADERRQGASYTHARALSPPRAMRSPRRLRAHSFAEKSLVCLFSFPLSLSTLSLLFFSFLGPLSAFPRVLRVV
jgi:hypothetical protein